MTAKRKKIIFSSVFLLLFIFGIGIGYLYKAAHTRYKVEKDTVVLISECNEASEIRDILAQDLGGFGEDVYLMWSLRGGEAHKAAGYYIVKAGDKAWSVASRIKAGLSSTIRVSFNSVRTIEDLAQRIAKYFTWDSSAFMCAMDSVLGTRGYNKATFPACFIPNTYEFYGNASPIEVVTKLSDYTNRFWDDSRREKARKLGLTPIEVHTVASIVEEEANDPEERSRIASLYLNRLRKGMRLQADPTVKFAIGDFSLRRITGEHLKCESPYNTYKVNGLPPGPIRIVDARTLDAVLDAPTTDYIYMCADETRPGFHNFTKDYEEHRANARRYQAWLNSKGIK